MFKTRRILLFQGVNDSDLGGEMHSALPPHIMLSSQYFLKTNFSFKVDDNSIFVYSL